MPIVGSSDITIKYDDAPGGSLSDITEHVQSDFAIGVANVMQNLKSQGDASSQWAPTGDVEMPDIIFSGFWNDTAGDPEDVFRLQAGDKSPFGDTRTLSIVVSIELKLEVETRLLDYKRLRRYPGGVKYRAQIRPVGDLTELDIAVLTEGPLILTEGGTFLLGGVI